MLLTTQTMTPLAVIMRMAGMKNEVLKIAML